MFKIKGLQKIQDLRPMSHRVWMDIILLLFIISYILSGTALAPFHGDESTYIWMSKDYDTIVKQRNIRSILFDPEEDLNVTEQRLRLSIGSILGLSIGFARDITNSPFEMKNKWNWGKVWDENVKQGSLPSSQLLALSRNCSALMGAMGMVFFFLVVRQLYPSRLAAWAATLLLATHGDVLLNVRRAMQEGPKFLFLLITLYIGSHILKALKNGSTSRSLYVLLGIASGFTLAAKQDAAAVLVAIYLALALIPLTKGTVRSILVNILFLGASTILAIATFLVLMPIFWGWWESVLALSGLVLLLFQIPFWNVSKLAKPLALAGCLLMIVMTIISPSQWRRLASPFTGMIEVRDTLVKAQVGNRIRFNRPYLNTGKSRVTFLLTTMSSSNVMYMEEESFNIDPINEQIATYENSHIRGRVESHLLDIFIILLFIVGWWGMLKRFSAEDIMAVSLFLVTAIILLVSIPLPWQRYFLIMQIPYSLIAGMGAEQLLEWGKQFIRQFANG